VADEQLREQVAELADTLGELERELREQPRRPRLEDLLRFTREVTIPAVILVLRTNIEALRLLQRALAFGDRGDSRLRERAEEAGRSALSGLDDALADLNEALSGTPQDGRARDLLEEARELQNDVESELARESQAGPAVGADEGVDIDVDAELRSLKDDIDDEDRDG
jgi:hypothetical protein